MSIKNNLIEASKQTLNTKMIWDRDVKVKMRDDVHLCVDVYRPDEPSMKFPVLLASALHNKDLQSPDVVNDLPAQPAWSSLWMGVMEAGDTRYLISNGYGQVIANPRGIGKSEDGPPSDTDYYDLIEWIAEQPWCDGNVGMIGISGYAGEQFVAAAQQPPHLKAIFPYDAASCYGGPMGLRDMHPGGVLHTMFYFLELFSVIHHNKGIPEPLPDELEDLLNEALNNPDYKMYAHLYNILTMKGNHIPGLFHLLINPYEDSTIPEKTEEIFKKIKIPVYTGSGWYAYTYKCHLQGCQNWYQGLETQKKMLFNGPAHLERPFHSFHNEIIRWYDYWLKGKDTGIMDEPSVKIWVMGENKWRYAEDWPLKETEWKKFYLHSWERMRTEPFETETEQYKEPDTFAQMPLTHTLKVQKLRYMTEPLAEDTLVIGPIALKLYASIDQDDTNWIVVLKDVGPDVSVRTAREGETKVPGNLEEREITRGWLKASNRELDKSRSKPWKPWHKLTKEASKPVTPGEITEYPIEILSTANMFKKGHRICIDIASLDVPTGTGGLANVEYNTYHICSSKTVVHKIYHNNQYPSHLLLPVIPN